jgi:hypothetical protein
VACHSPSYIDKYDIASEVKPGGVLLLNCPGSRGAGKPDSGRGAAHHRKK